MYDTVIAYCPRCEKPAEFQSKSGPCELATHLLEEAPSDVLLDVMQHGPSRCDCGCTFGIKVETVSRGYVYISKGLK